MNKLGVCCKEEQTKRSGNWQGKQNQKKILLFFKTGELAVYLYINKNDPVQNKRLIMQSRKRRNGGVLLK